MGHLTAAEERASEAADLDSPDALHQPHAERIARRDALKKAATGAAVAGGGLNYGNDWAAVSPATNPGITVTSPQPNARNAAINMDYVVPSPPSSVNVDALIPAGWDADLNATQNVTMSFTVDPPWNRCRVNAVAMNKCDGNAGTVNIDPTNPASGANNPAPFSVNVAVPGPQPSNVAQVRITVGCT